MSDEGLKMLNVIAYMIIIPTWNVIESIPRANV